jgi:hypothetical protein
MMTRERELEFANIQLATEYKRVRTDWIVARQSTSDWRACAIVGWMFFAAQSIAWIIWVLT